MRKAVLIKFIKILSVFRFILKNIVYEDMKTCNLIEKMYDKDVDIDRF